MSGSPVALAKQDSAPHNPAVGQQPLAGIDVEDRRETPSIWANLQNFPTSEVPKPDPISSPPNRDRVGLWTRLRQSRMARHLRKFLRFVGPGFLVSVSFVDAGNFSTGVAAGAQFRFALLDTILLSTILAIFVQYLSLRLGTVTGRDLAQTCRDHLPRWLNLLCYLFAECAILATDIAEVVGSAIALNLLTQGKLPLPAGVAITVVDVIVILAFYQNDGSKGVTRTQIFELSIAVLVVALATCLSVELAKISGVNAGEVLRGYIPSGTVFRGGALYASCGIIGATVMPHSLFLGSGVVQVRVKDYDVRHGIHTPASALTRPASFASSQSPTALELEKAEENYRPSLEAIRNCLPYSTSELVLALISISFYVNSAILILAGATLSNTPSAANADLFSVYELLKTQLSQAAATIFAVSLLFSGMSAGLVVTLTGQIVMEGHLRWSIPPWQRRLITRLISIIPCMAVASSVGRHGLSTVLNGSQVALSIILPVVSAPLIYFTCRKNIMSVRVHQPASDPASPPPPPPEPTNAEEEGRTTSLTGTVDLSNGWFLSAIGLVVWVFIAGLNLFLVISLALGRTG